MASELQPPLGKSRLPGARVSCGPQPCPLATRGRELALLTPPLQMAATMVPLDGGVPAGTFLLQAGHLTEPPERSPRPSAAWPAARRPRRGRHCFLPLQPRGHGGLGSVCSSHLFS